MSAKFSIRVTNHQGSTVLNMCDADLLGRNVDDKGHVINISKNYYGEKIIHIAEAKNLLKKRDNNDHGGFRSHYGGKFFGMDASAECHHKCFRLWRIS